ncbi:MAG: hypothetical protein NUV97_00075 [archaeon]|nr:hypothetical protein [archaeon]MCR4323386.1 hypothetical protein [Nanoarchaeota archaeon]
MDEDVRVSMDERETRIIEYPFEDLEVVGDGKLVSRRYDGVLAFRSWPFVARILKKGFLDARWHEGWCGTHTNMDDIGAGESLYIKRPEDWEDSPRVGRAFYGIVGHHDAATLSDFCKREDLGDDLVLNGSTIVEGGGMAMVMGNPQRFHRDVYLSFPIKEIRTMRVRGLGNVLLNRGMSEEERSRRLSRL